MKNGSELTSKKDKTVMTTKVSIEEEVKKLQKHVGGMAMMLKDLKHSVEVLERRVSANENDAIKQILDALEVVDKKLKTNLVAIKWIDEEIFDLSRRDVATDGGKVTPESVNHGQDGKTKSWKLKKDVVAADTKDTLESINQGQEGESKSRKLCKYYNRGYCKYEMPVPSLKYSLSGTCQLWILQQTKV